MKDIQEFINQLRKDYSKKELNESSVSSDPFQQFSVWFEEAVKASLPDPNAFNMATVSAEGKPSSRIVLLRGFDQNGFTFYTNYESNKGKDLASNPWVAMNFFWPELEKQIRIDGEVAMVSVEQSDNYFNSRPRESQIGAWVSQQSSEIDNRSILSEKEKEITERFKNRSVPRPPYWGGYNIRPFRFEFWQGRPNRLHDRIVYEFKEPGTWNIKRLAP